MKFLQIEISFLFCLSFSLLLAKGISDRCISGLEQFIFMGQGKFATLSLTEKRAGRIWPIQLIAQSLWVRYVCAFLGFKY